MQSLICGYAAAIAAAFALARTLVAPAAARRWFPLTRIDVIAQAFVSAGHTAAGLVACLATLLAPGLFLDAATRHVTALGIAFYALDAAFIFAADMRRQLPYVAHHAASIALYVQFAAGDLGPAWAVRLYFLSIELSNAFVVAHWLARRNPGTSPVDADDLLTPLALSFAPLRSLHASVLATVMIVYDPRAAPLLLFVQFMSIADSARLVSRLRLLPRSVDVFTACVHTHVVLLAFVLIGTPITRAAVVAAYVLPRALLIGRRPDGSAVRRAIGTPA